MMMMEELSFSLDVEESMIMTDASLLTTKHGETDGECSSSRNLESFSVTLDSIQILPHWEVLDARIEALEERMPQRTLDETAEQLDSKRRKAEGMKLIEDEERKGRKRKKERELKRKLKREMKERELGGGDDEIMVVDDVNGGGSDDETIATDEHDESNDNNNSNKGTSKKGNNNNNNSFNGPCVIYLSPNDESRMKLESLRERLRTQIFPGYDAFSPSSSVSPYPEQLPRKTKLASSSTSDAAASSQFRPLLPIARFATVSDAVKVAKVLQQTWDPLTFNVTDIQFVSRDDSDLATPSSGGDTSSTTSNGVGFGNKNAHSDMDIPEVRHRQKHGTLSSSMSAGTTLKGTTMKDNGSHQRMALTTSGEVEDVSNLGIYGCDAMVMLWGEEPEEELMDEEASLSMIMDDNQEGSGERSILNGNGDAAGVNNGKINYDEIFATAEREYQRMEAHEELSGLPIFDEAVTDIEAWLDDEDDGFDDEGATAVIGRAQFFMGAMREFIG